MNGKAETWSERVGAASAAAAAAEGHESMPAVEDDDIEGALAAAEDEQAQRREQRDEAPSGEVSNAVPRPVKTGRGTTQAHTGQAPTEAKTKGQTADWRERFASVIALAAANQPQDRPAPRTAAEIHAEMAQLRRQLARVAKRIPKRQEKLKAAVIALLKYPDEAKPLSARRAACDAGLAGELADKLAYRVPVEGETVNAGICLLRRAPFVSQLRQDEGWLRQVTGKHASLAALAKTLENARRSLIGRTVASPSRRARPGSQPQAPAARKGNRRGAWHVDAWALEDQGFHPPDIATKLRKSSNAVQKALSKRRKAEQE